MVTEQFEKLAKVILKSQNVLETIMVLVKGNPENVSDEELVQIADGVLEAAVTRLTGAATD